METQESLNYRRIAKAIDYIRSHYREQPGLEQVADYVGLSSMHFQRIFTDWAGVSPKNFLKHVSIQHARHALGSDNPPKLAEVTHVTGLSGTSRLHDLFISIDGMTPAEYKSGGRNLRINYQREVTPLGAVMVASTGKGVCYLAFFEGTEAEALEVLKIQFPNAVFQYRPDEAQQQALSIFRNDWGRLPSIKLHLKGTPFQLKVWECLLKIPMGKTSTYGTVASRIGVANAYRAVGTAIGNNPVAFLIPCHRIIRGDGQLGGYRWDPSRKQVLLAWEKAVVEEVSHRSGVPFAEQP